MALEFMEQLRKIVTTTDLQQSVNMGNASKQIEGVDSGFGPTVRLNMNVHDDDDDDAALETNVKDTGQRVFTP